MRDGEIFWVRFVGKDLHKKSVPIYELADTLIAVQRVVNKMRLDEDGRLSKGAHLSRKQRLEVSLQIVDHQKRSDAWGLLPFVSDPKIVGYAFDLMKAGLLELAKYSLKKVLSRDQSNRISGSALTGAIYAETVSITNHIYNIGNIERIELGLGDSPPAKPVVFTEETREYVRSIKNETYEGAPITIDGLIRKLDFNRHIVEVRLGPRLFTRVRVEERDFEKVRREAKTGDTLRFRGVPIYRLGKDSFDEFCAKSYLGVTKRAENE